MDFHSHTKSAKSTKLIHMKCSNKIFNISSINRIMYLTRLDEAEIRFRTRESRPEDTELLDTLKRVLAERELEMKKLLVRHT